MRLSRMGTQSGRMSFHLELENNNNNNNNNNTGNT